MKSACDSTKVSKTSDSPPPPPMLELNSVLNVKLLG